jgi:hypothetical protein
VLVLRRFDGLICERSKQVRLKSYVNCSLLSAAGVRARSSRARSS